MPPTVAVCPYCAAQVPVAENTESGTDIRCPECDTVFAGPAESAELVGVEDLSSHNYSLDLATIFNRGWNSFTQGMGMLVGVTLVGILLSIPFIVIVVLPQLIPIIGTLLGSVVSSATLLPLWCGLIVIALAQIRGQPWSFGDFFSGFRFWVPLFAFGMIASTVSWVCTLPAAICTFLAGASPLDTLQHVLQGDFGKPFPQPDPMLNLLGQVFNLAGLVVMIIINMRYFVACPFLIIDRQYGAIEAIKANAALTQGHVFGWLGIALLFGLIAGAGFLVCCVGMIFTVPLYFFLMTSAYLEATTAAR